MSEQHDNRADEKDNPIARIMALRRGIVENPQSAEAHCDLGVAIIQMGDPKTAITYFKQALKCDANHERSHYNLGLCYQQIGFIDNAISSYEAVIRLNPQDDQAWNNLAALFSERNELIEAIECFQKSLEINPDRAETWFSLASAQFSLKKYDDAIQSAKKSLELDDNRFWCWLQLGQSHYAVHHAEDAIAAFLRATELKADNDKCWNNLGNAYLLKDNFEDAEAAYRKAIGLNGNNADYWFNLGELLFIKKSYLEAANFFSKVVQSNEQDIEALEYLVKSLLEVAPLEAVQKLKSLIRVKGEDPEYLNMLARAYHQVGNPEEEARTRLKLASTRPLDAENNYALVHLLASQGKRDLAFSFLKDSQQHANQDPELWYRFAQSFRLEQRLEEEFECLTRTVKADPTHQNAWLRLGLIALQHDDEGSALPYLEKADPLLANDVTTWLSACEKYLNLGKTNLAIECSLKLISLVRLVPLSWRPINKLFRRFKKEEQFVSTLLEYIPVNDLNNEILVSSLELIYHWGYGSQVLDVINTHLQKKEISVQLRRRLCRLYLLSDQPEAAKAIILDGSDLQNRSYDLLIARAQIELYLDQPDLAESTILEGLSFRQDDYEGWYLLGLVCQKQEKFDLALPHLDKSLSLYGEDAQVWLAKALVLIAMKQNYNAEKLLKKALKLNRQSSQTWLALAKLKAGDSEYSSARFKLLRALAADRKNRDAWLFLADILDHLNQQDNAKACREEAERLSSKTSDTKVD